MRQNLGTALTVHQPPEQWMSYIQAGARRSGGGATRERGGQSAWRKCKLFNPRRLRQYAQLIRAVFMCGVDCINVQMSFYNTVRW